MNQEIKRCDIKCENCGETEKIQISVFADSGYSDYTVEDRGQFELKCVSCGKFGSSDEYKKEPSNEMKNFTVMCHGCRGIEWEFSAGNVDGDVDSEVNCKNCKTILLKDDNKIR
jgi:hypothetical protein